MSFTRCSKCQSKAVRSYARPGRTVRYRNIAAMPIPDSFPIPTCSRCHAEFFDARTSEALVLLLHEQYLEQLRQRAKQAIDILMRHITQRRLELLLGLSQGYLCLLYTSRCV